MKEERELLTEFAKWCLGKVVTYSRGATCYWVDLDTGKGLTFDELIDKFNNSRS